MWLDDCGDAKRTLCESVRGPYSLHSEQLHTRVWGVHLLHPMPPLPALVCLLSGGEASCARQSPLTAGPLLHFAGWLRSSISMATPTPNAG